MGGVAVEGGGALGRGIGGRGGLLNGGAEKNKRRAKREETCQNGAEKTFLRKPVRKSNNGKGKKGSNRRPAQ